MGEMWKVVKETGTATTGINHWGYLPNCRMFTGIELLPGVIAPAGLEPLQFELRCYLKHLHVGQYQALPAGGTASQMPRAQHKKPAQDVQSEHDVQLRINAYSKFLVPAAPYICDAEPPDAQSAL